MNRTLQCRPRYRRKRIILVLQQVFPLVCFYLNIFINLKATDIFLIQWSFEFFDTILFLNALGDVINRAGGSNITPGEITDFNLIICNANKKEMQRVPFAIIYEP